MDWLKSPLRVVDPEIAEAIEKETLREERKIVLIASENYTSEAVLEAQGGVLTNKYAEGYPDRRYYGGCEYVDIVERLAIRSSSVRSTPTCSPSPAPPPIWGSTSRSLSPGTPSWGWTSPMEDT